MNNIIKGVFVIGLGVVAGIVASKLIDDKSKKDELNIDGIPEEIMEQLDDDTISDLKNIQNNIKKECRKTVIFNTIIDGVIKIGIPLVIFRLIAIKQRRIMNVTSEV